MNVDSVRIEKLVVDVLFKTAGCFSGRRDLRFSKFRALPSRGSPAYSSLSPPRKFSDSNGFCAAGRYLPTIPVKPEWIWIGVEPDQGAFPYERTQQSLLGQAFSTVSGNFLLANRISTI